jgi:transposase
MFDFVTRVKSLARIEYLNLTFREAAKATGVSKSTLARWSHMGPAPVKRVRTSPKLTSVRQQVGVVLGHNQYLSIEEVRSHLDVNVSWSTVRRCMKALKLSYKATCRTHKKQPVDLRHPYFLANSPYADLDCICIDEASLVSCDTPRRAWSHVGDTVHKHPPKRRRVVSLLLAIDRSGVVAHEIRVGSFNQHSFSAFIEKLPSERPLLMDNASIHKTALVREACGRNNIRPIYTPPYCPWFNPVEFAFSVVKRRFRKLRATRTETIPEFHPDITRSLENVTADKCVSFFAHSERLRCQKILGAP